MTTAATKSNQVAAATAAYHAAKAARHKAWLACYIAEQSQFYAIAERAALAAAYKACWEAEAAMNEAWRKA